MLEIYLPSMGDKQCDGPSSQSVVNQLADDVLEALAMKNEIRFLTTSIAPLLKVEQPPRLQALLKVLISRIKATVLLLEGGDPRKLDSDVRQESHAHIVEALIKQSEFYAEVINHTNADVRKCCVFALVEIHTALTSVMS